jgi:hypothetical protein
MKSGWPKKPKRQRQKTKIFAKSQCFNAKALLLRPAKASERSFRQTKAGRESHAEKPGESWSDSKAR